MEEKDSKSDIIFCGMCSVRVRKGVKYCWSCNADQTASGPPNELLQPGRADTSFGRPQLPTPTHATELKRKAMSLNSYMKAKSCERQSGSEFRSNKKANNKEDKEVVISIGLKELCDMGLKTIRGKRLPLRVPQSATYDVILQKAVQKWSAYDKKFDASKQYVLLYDDETYARFMPGEPKEFFSLNKYKIEVGKDFKRIVFYLCKVDEFDSYEEREKSPAKENHFDVNEFFNADFPDDEIFVIDDFNDGGENDGGENGGGENGGGKNDGGERDGGGHLTQEDQKRNESASSQASAGTTPELVGHASHLDVIKEISSRVNYGSQFFLTTRRKAPFSRILSLWKRQASKCDPMDVLKVHYCGEDGIDSGALALEFLEECISEMGKIMFPDGSPVYSSSHVESGNFRACGQIVAVSLAQGGPPPCFLEQCSYEAGFSEVDMMNIGKENLTAKELKLLDEVRSDCVKYTELILDHGYTGQIGNEHVEAIIRSLKVSFVSRRCLYMKEFMIGLKLYGLDVIIQQKPLLCQPLFVNGDLKNGLIPNADYVFSLMVPHYSKKGTSRRCIEEDLMDHLQDTLMAFEDENVTGHTGAVAWNYKDGTAEEAPANEPAGNEVLEEFETPCVNIPGVMGWLTGMQHKPLNGEKPKISVSFDHECLERNPKHSICFPIVSACGRTLTIPVVHMRDARKFKEIFLMAYCKGQAFGKP